jgi:hypothetical protein
VHFGRVNHRVIAVIGARDAGKTHFIAVLINELRKRAPQLMSATLSSQGDETRNLYAQYYYSPLYEKKTLLPPTDRALRNPLVRKPLFYRLEFNRHLSWLPAIRWRRAVNLVFFDAAGEDITEERTLSLHCRYVWNAAALVFLLDPLSFEGVYHRLQGEARASTQREGGSPLDNVDRLVDVLEKHGGLAPGKPVQMPVAFTLTKLDALAPRPNEPNEPEPLIDAKSPLLQPGTHEQGVEPDEFERITHEVRSHIGSWQHGLLGHLDKKFPKAGFFAVSSLGSPPNGTSAPTPAPLRVEDPLLWILWRLGYVQRRPDPEQTLMRRLERLLCYEGPVATWLRRVNALIESTLASRQRPPSTRRSSNGLSNENRPRDSAGKFTDPERNGAPGPRRHVTPPGTEAGSRAKGNGTNGT